MAERSGLSVRTIRNLEQGVRRPRGGSLRLLADALDLTESQYGQLAVRARDVPAATMPAVCQLPHDLPDFTGRAMEVAVVATELKRRSVVMLAGKPGVGKTALAVHLAHLLQERFPDGQLYADLRGTDPKPRDPHRVLRQFLQDLGVKNSAIPADPDEIESAYRAVLVGRRMLILLDNAGPGGQVRPLLPGGAGSAVLLTGRSRSPVQAGMWVIDVDVLAPEQAVDLLAAVAGRERVAAAPEAARTIVDLCGGLPLAVRIAGLRLAGRPNWPLDRLASLLDDEAGRLNQLAVGELEVRASLSLSYRTLSEPARRAFRLLGSVPVGEFAPWLLAPLLDLSVGEGERLLDQLLDACLLDATTGADRYRLPGLIRIYARECAQEEDPKALRAASDRLNACWLGLAETADQRLPTSSDVVAVGSAPRWSLGAERTDEILGDPLGWFEVERDNLVAAVRAAAAVDRAEVAWELVGPMLAWIKLRNDFATFEDVQLSTVAACVRAHDVRGQAVMAVYSLLARAALKTRAVDDDPGGWAAVAVFRRLGDLRAETVAVAALACAHHAEPPRMHRHASEALRLARRAGLRTQELVALQMIGQAAQALGRPTEATDAYEQALPLARSLGAVGNEADLLWQMAQIAVRAGRHQQAIALLDQALRLTRRIGSRTGEASVLATLAETLLDSGRSTEARRRLEESLAVRPRNGPRMDLDRIQNLLVRLGGIGEQESG